MQHTSLDCMGGVGGGGKCDTGQSNLSSQGFCGLVFVCFWRGELFVWYRPIKFELVGFLWSELVGFSDPKSDFELRCGPIDISIKKMHFKSFFGTILHPPTLGLKIVKNIGFFCGRAFCVIQANQTWARMVFVTCYRFPVFEKPRRFFKNRKILVSFLRFLKKRCFFYKNRKILVSFLRFLKKTVVFTKITKSSWVFCVFWKKRCVFTKIAKSSWVFCFFWKKLVVFTKIAKSSWVFCVFWKKLVVFTKIAKSSWVFCAFWKKLVVFTKIAKTSWVFCVFGKNAAFLQKSQNPHEFFALFEKKLGVLKKNAKSSWVFCAFWKKSASFLQK